MTLQTCNNAQKENEIIVLKNAYKLKASLQLLQATLSIQLFEEVFHVLTIVLMLPRRNI